VLSVAAWLAWLAITIGFGANPVIQILFTLAFGALPVCLGVAVLKYRLYELDRIISRVVAYTLITALLAGVFAGLVVVGPRVLPFQDSVSVAVSTLVTAALFNPLRRRVQRAVDHRFNRSRYNAEAVVAAYTARLRHSVELDVIQRDLIGVPPRQAPASRPPWLHAAIHDLGASPPRPPFAVLPVAVMRRVP
jgi:hypothetical protein